MSQSAAGRRWMRWTVSRLFVLHAASRVARKSGGGGKPGLPSRIARIIARHDSEAGRRSPRGQGSYRVGADPVRRADQRRRATAHQIASARAKGQERMNTA